jgi:drug/metabolite transporter (DMT)-like permease
MNSEAARRHARGYTQVGFCALLATASEIMLKSGALATAGHASAVPWLGYTALDSPWVWGGMLLQVLGFISYAAALRTLPVSVAFSMLSVLHVTIPLSSWMVFGERIHAVRWAGIALVLAGIWLIARPVEKIEERTA